MVLQKGEAADINRDDMVRNSDSELEFHKLWSRKDIGLVNRRPTVPPNNKDKIIDSDPVEYKEDDEAEAG